MEREAVRLIKLRLQRFRRFAESQTLDLNEDLIALVGPNEAGKSSILDAIDLLGSRERPDRTDLTRGQTGNPSVFGLFVLEEADRALLSQIHEGPAVTHAWVEQSEGARTNSWTLEPRPSRDLAPRRRCRDLVTAIAEQEALDATYSVDGEDEWDPQLFSDVLVHLGSDDETFSDETNQSLESLARGLRNLSYPPVDEDEDHDEDEAEAERGAASEDELERQTSETERHSADRENREAAASALIDLARLERQAPPVRQAVDVLRDRLPEVAFFREADRDLQRDYAVAEVSADPPSALANLCALAELNLADVQTNLEAGRIPHVEKVFEKANSVLKERFQATWSQSTVYPRLSTPSDGVLRILIATEGDADYSYPEERSDGLRWFIALRSFLAARGSRDPILLVDEAETHLHYDAQADLVDALMSQQITSKVIYTTHSVGCLPPDLGCGIRVVLAEEGAERSRIVNSYWSVVPEQEDRVGYTPLLFAMGARMLSLTIPRFGVIAEGPADAILLPSLLREASGVERLAYRIVPGLAELAEDRVDNVHHHAGKVLCLTDGDDGGNAIRQKLIAGGVPEETIFDLGQVIPGCTLEDLVREDIFALAVNEELKTWALGPMQIDPGEVPSIGRWSWLVAQGKLTGTPVDKLSKPRIAQRIVDVRRTDEAHVSASRLRDDVAEALRDLHEAFSLALGLMKD